MGKSASSKEDKTSQVSCEAPSTTFIQLDGKSAVASEFRSGGSFSVVRLQSSVGLSQRIRKLSDVPGLLVSISLKSLPASSYRVWASERLYPTSFVHPFRCNIADFGLQPGCWAGRAFDFVHYSVPRTGLNEMAEDLGLGRVRDYRAAVLKEDLVVGQVTRSMLPFLGRKDALSILALDQISLILQAHLIQQYGVLQKAARYSKGGLAAWQQRRAEEILHENMHGRIRLSEVARECGLSTSHFARSFKTSFGISAHQWLIQHRIEYAKTLMVETTMSLLEIAVQSGFSDQPAFTRTFQQIVGVSPGHWRRCYTARPVDA